MTSVVKNSGAGSLAVLLLGPVLVPILIPVGTGLVWWWLLQWYWLAARRPALIRDEPASLWFHDSEDDPRVRASLTDLICAYRVAKFSLWIGALFWPTVVIAILIVYQTMDGRWAAEK